MQLTINLETTLRLRMSAPVSSPHSHTRKFLAARLTSTFLFRRKINQTVFRPDVIRSTGGPTSSAMVQRFIFQAALVDWTAPRPCSFQAVNLRRTSIQRFPTTRLAFLSTF